MYNILIVDDNEDMMSVFESYLHHHGEYFIEKSYNAVESYQKCHDIRESGEGGLDLIIMDINLPDVNGFDAARKIREDNPEIPFLFITAYESPEIKAEYDTFKNATILEKPINYKEFCNALATYLNQ